LCWKLEIVYSSKISTKIDRKINRVGHLIVCYDDDDDDDNNNINNNNNNTIVCYSGVHLNKD